MMEKTLSLDTCPALMTVPELARVLRIGRNTAYRLVAEKKIPALKIGRQVRIYRDDVIRYVSGHDLAE